MNTSGPYQLSCIVPVYNVEQYLGDCVESLLRVSSIRMEIILVDDGSTDSSSDIVDSYAAQYADVKVIHQANEGLSAARNCGLIVASGEYIAFVDSDDWINSEQLTSLYRKAICDKADVILGNVRYVASDELENSPFLPLPESVVGKVLSGEACFVEFIRFGKFVPMVCSYLYRRKWLEQNKLRFEPVVHEDELWSVEALCLAERVVCTDWPFYYYRQRPGSIMNTLETGKRINDLIYIANRILCFSGRFDRREKRQVWSMLYVKAAQLYKLAFVLLDKKRDSRFHLYTNSLYQLYHGRNRLIPDARSICLSYYTIARKKLKNYHTWLVSPEVADIAAVIPVETTVLLFYNRMWEMPLTYPRKHVPKDMLITSDQKYLDRADIVVFHLPTLEFDLEGDLDKPVHQRWVGWTRECEENYPFIKSTEFMSLFDYWMSYHQGADVQIPYYRSDYPARFRESVFSDNSRNGICMLVSSPFNRSGRQEYLKELMRNVSIDSYGKLYNNSRMQEDKGRSSKMALYEQYKFIIAFENSCAEDYVTEKFFDPLLVGAVPVYFGASNIDEFAPGDNCYVDVRKYKTAAELAAHLKACLEEPALYEQYQQWRKQPLREVFVLKAAQMQEHPFIRLCRLVKEEPFRKDYRREIDGKFCFCSFGDSCYQESHERLQEEAEDFNMFDVISLYNEFDLPSPLRNDSPIYLKNSIRCLGYWFWKPRIILDVLAGMNDGDVLLYVDIDCHLNSQGKEKMFSYWKEAKENTSGFLVSEDFCQVLFIRKELATVALLQSWRDIYENDFFKYRYDPGALSLLLKRHGASVIPLEEVYRPVWNLYSRYYPILLKRDCRFSLSDSTCPEDDGITFVIPFRIDSSERQRNLDMLLEQLSVRKQTKVILLEADTGSVYKMKKTYPNVRYYFVKDDSPVFYRTKYVNELLRKADTSVAGVWNTDMLVPDDQMDNAITEICNGSALMSIPGDGRFLVYSIEESFLYRQGFLNPFLPKEKETSDYSSMNLSETVFFVNKEAYLKTGGENEHLYGGIEENRERIKRLEILGMPIAWVTGVIYRLTHRHNTSIGFYNRQLESDNINEYLHVCGLTKEAMAGYICSGSHISDVMEKKIYLSTLNQNAMKIPLGIPLRSPFLDNYFCLIEEYNMAFVAIAKNAVTHLKNIVVSSKYGFYPDSEEVHSFIGYNDFSSYLCPVAKMRERENETGKLIKFAVWRDPVERLVSCYKHFCLERTSHYYFNLLGVYENNSFDYFMSIVRLELSKRDPLYQDEHIRRQSDYYRPEDVDYIVPIHKLNQFLEEQGVPLLRKSANETSVDFKLTNPAYIAEIKDLYKSDYEIVTTY